MQQQAVEKIFLRQVDNRAALVRAKLLRDGLASLTLDERTDWTLFLMSLRLRQPDIVQSLRTDAAAELRRQLSEQPEQYEELAGERDPPTLEELAERRFVGLIDNAGLSLFQAFVDNPTVATKILRMRWWLWDFSRASDELLLADHPCISTRRLYDPQLVIALPIGCRTPIHSFCPELQPSDRV